MVLANRAYERQAGILKLMQEAGQAKREYAEAKRVFEEKLETFKKTRGEMSPEQAATENIRLRTLLDKKVAARARQTLATSIIISENKFLAQFGADVGEREGETHSARKRRTRVQISRYFNSNLECKFISRDGEVLPQRPDGDDVFVVTEEISDILSFLNDATSEKSPKREVTAGEVFVTDPPATTVGILTGTQSNATNEVVNPEAPLPANVLVT